MKRELAAWVVLLIFLLLLWWLFGLVLWMLRIISEPEELFDDLESCDYHTCLLGGVLFAGGVGFCIATFGEVSYLIPALAAGIVYIQLTVAFYRDLDERLTHKIEYPES
jgi:ABC-type glucose/galactose transport system permease subunit